MSLAAIRAAEPQLVGAQVLGPAREGAKFMEQLEELIGYIARSLVDDPDAVEVEALDGKNTIVVELTVARSDLGKVIGREGRTARAIRTLLAAASARHQRRSVLEILE